MTNIEKIIQGLVLISLGFCIFKLRNKFVIGIKESHESFWNKKLKFQKQLGEREIKFAKFLLIVLGVCFLFGGASLVIMNL